MKTLEEIEKLGLTTAVKKLKQAEKMKKAYGKYLFITQNTVNKFNEKLKVDTLIEDKHSTSFKRLVFISLEQYSQLPPDDVLEALNNAQKDDCFDTYEIAKIDWIKEVKDPILFGVIEGCADKFFISQWDDDVKIEDLLFME